MSNSKGFQICRLPVVLVLKLRLIIIVFDLNSNCVFNFSLHLYSYVLSFPLSQLFQLLILFCRYLGDVVHLKTMKQTEAPPRVTH